MSWRIFTHHILKGSLRTVQLFFLVAVPAVILWLQFVGLPSFLHDPVKEAARQQDLDLSFSSMRVSLLQGIVLDNVRLSAKSLPPENEIMVDRASVAVDWRRLLHGKFEINALELRGAQVYLPVASVDGVTRSLRVTKAHARVVLADGVASVSFARFNFQGVDVTASGQIFLQGESPTPSPGNILPPEAAQALELLQSVDFGSMHPKLAIEFISTGGTTGTWQVPVIRFEAPEAALGTIFLRDIQLDASFLDGRFSLRSLAARDDKDGTFEAAGRWNATTGEADAEIESSLDPAGWLSEFLPSEKWDGLGFIEPLVVRATLHAGGEKPRRLQVLGSIESRALSYGGLKFQDLQAGFVWREGGEFYADRISVRAPDGPIAASFMLRPGDVRVHLDLHADPLPLVPLLGEKVSRSMDKIEIRFIDPPHIVLEMQGEKPDPAALRATGRAELGRTSIHGSEMDSATADLGFENLALTFSNMRVQRPEGTGSGAFVYDFGKQKVVLRDIRSTMMPFNVLQWADPKVASETKPYRFKGPPQVNVSGVIDLDHSRLTDIKAQFDAAKGLEYDLLDRTLSFGATSGTLRFKGRQVTVAIPSAQLYGGRVRLDAAIAIGGPGATQRMTVNLDHVDFETLTRLYFGYKDSKGLVSGRYDFTFVADKPRLMAGKGNLLVEDGNVFAIPVLGPLSFLLDSIIPGTGYQTSRRATCDFRVADGEIRTDNLEVIGTGFVMIGQGSLFFVEDRMDFGVRVNVQGVPGILLYPVSKLFEYVSDGKMSDPKWRPRVLPKNDRGQPDKKPPVSGEAKSNGRA